MPVLLEKITMAIFRDVSAFRKQHGNELDVKGRLTHAIVAGRELEAVNVVRYAMNGGSKARANTDGTDGATDATLDMENVAGIHKELVAAEVYQLLKHAG